MCIPPSIALAARVLIPNAGLRTEGNEPPYRTAEGLIAYCALSAVCSIILYWVLVATAAFNV